MESRPRPHTSLLPKLPCLRVYIHLNIVPLLYLALFHYNSELVIWYFCVTYLVLEVEILSLEESTLLLHLPNSRLIRLSATCNRHHITLQRVGRYRLSHHIVRQKCTRYCSSPNCKIWHFRHTRFVLRGCGIAEWLLIRCFLHIRERRHAGSSFDAFSLELE